MSEPRVPKGAWLTAAFLFFFMLTNFADKVVIGIAGVSIMQELQLTPREFGIVGSSFFFLFSLSAVITGFIVNRVQTRWALLIMGLIWALSQFPMVGTVGMGTLVACRIALGAGEGPAWPVALHALFKWFPNELRTLPTAVIGLGGPLGIILAPPMLNWIIVHYSWHWAFGTLGVIGLSWTGAWLAFGREGAVDVAAQGVDSNFKHVFYRQLLLSPTFTATWCTMFGGYWALTLILTWYPVFLVKGLGFAQQDIGILSALPSAGILVIYLATGWCSQYLLLRGASSRLARSVLGSALVGCGGIALLAMPLMPTTALVIAMMTMGTALPAAIYMIVPAIVSEITPVSQRGALLAIGNALGTSAGILAPYVMGSVVETAATPLDGFHNGFMICGLIMVVGSVIGITLMRPEREVERWGLDVPGVTG